MIQLHSQKIQPGDTFICLPGGEDYISDALERGAVAYKKMTRAELGPWASEYFGHPSHTLRVVGITGTNGKTTVSQLVGQGLTTAGYRPYVLGTLNAPLTTPESLDVQRLMAEHLANSGTHFVMEVSSHAIDQGRILGIEFFVRLLTNITQDHLDYHKTFKAYTETKMSFMQADANAIYPEDFAKENITFPNPLKGDFNHKNMQAAVAILKRLGLEEPVIQKAMSEAKAPAGRFETIEAGQPFTVIVDYAHTPDGLENVLKEAQKIAKNNKGRLITLFGCGGNRDRGKRPKMAAIAAALSDFVIITHDNPRGEDPQQIITDVLEGIPQETSFKVIEDRQKAIYEAINMAEPNDCVMLAGKGHETYQILHDKTIHFDDREMARDAIKQRLS
jgi:UDP-N-acetylmuramoyl-L-alanyl-D-glutamate--2,6-diaminopimelate ligase